MAQCLRLHPKLTVSRLCWEALRWWRQASHLSEGVRIGVIHNRHLVMTDAPNSGWGGGLGRQRISRTLVGSPDIPARKSVAADSSMSRPKHPGFSRKSQVRERFSSPSGPGESGFLPSASCCMASSGRSTSLGSPQSGERLSLAPRTGQVLAMGLAPERNRWLALGLSDVVVGTLQSAKADSTRSLYTYKWRYFQAWCLARSHDPISCPMPVILQFLQELLDAGRSPSTLKVYLAAISACHAPVDSMSPGAHFLAVRFLKGAWRLCPPQKALTKASFEPIHSIELKYLSTKTAFLLAITSTNWVSELQALSVHSSCMHIGKMAAGCLCAPTLLSSPR
ncbi:UNVERIFIED_CONTAM: hypothetical protein FKN15_043109 [Acipenser sinensis]